MKEANNEYWEKYWDDDFSFEDTFELSDEDEFSIGAECSGPDKKIICKKCGSDRWIVGKGDFHTSIKCPNCLYEYCIHAG